MTTGESTGNQRNHLSHVSSSSNLLAVFVLLVVLTFATVAISSIPTGPFEIWIALGIASLKAFLVGAFFMHLKYDKPLNGLVLALALLTLVLFLALTLADSTST